AFELCVEDYHQEAALAGARYSTRRDSARGVSEAQRAWAGRSRAADRGFVEPVERNCPRQTEHHGRYGVAACATFEDITAIVDAAPSGLGPPQGAGARDAEDLVV